MMLYYKARVCCKLHISEPMVGGYHKITVAWSRGQGI
jgi:hypothetical protein